MLHANHAGSDSMLNNATNRDSISSKSAESFALKSFDKAGIKLYRTDLGSSLDELISRGSKVQGRIPLKKDKWHFHGMPVFEPSLVDEYMGVYKKGGFQFPIGFGDKTVYKDEDVVESWEYQKGLMYPYGHTPLDFYEP